MQIISSNKNKIPIVQVATVLAIMVIILVGYFFYKVIIDYGTKNEEQNLLARAITAAASFDPVHISALEGTPEDLDTSNYADILSQLVRIIHANKDARFTNLLALKNDKIVFLADAEPPTSEDYVAPGDPFEGDSSAYMKVLSNGVSSVEGPYKDKWGVWVSGLVPIRDSKTSKIIAVFGIDIDAKNWKKRIAVFRWFSITVTGFFASIAFTTVGIFVWNRKLNEEIVRRKRIEKDLQQMATAVEHSPSIVFITDKKGAIEYVNPKFVEVTGYTAVEIVGKNPRILKSGTRSKEDYEDLWKTILDGKEWRGEYLNKRKDGEEYWVAASISSIFNTIGEISYFVCVQEDITEKKKAEEEIRYLANHDALTELPSLRLGKDRLEHAITIAKRKKNKVALMFIDLDGFKAVNDTLGHEAGDMVLRVTATRLRDSVREMDTVARIGGDEFIIILSELQDNEGLAKVARRIIEAVRQEIRIEEHMASIGASVGIALYPDHAKNSDELLREADKAMYQVKKAGKNNFSFAYPIAY